MAVDFIGDGLALRSKGDIVSNDGTSDVVVSVGSDNQILVAQSSSSSGIVWQNQSTAAEPAVIAIASSVVTANVASVTFSGLPSGYRSFRVIMVAKHTATTTGGQSYTITVNSLTSGYSEYRRYIQQGTTTAADINVASSTVSYTAQINTNTGVLANANAGGAKYRGVGVFDFVNGTTDRLASMTCINGSISPNTTSAPYAFGEAQYQITGLESDITSIVFTSNFNTQTFFEVYGIK